MWTAVKKYVNSYGKREMNKKFLQKIKTPEKLSGDGRY